MKITEFLPIHFKWLQAMHYRHESPSAPFIISETLPKIGFIVSDAERYIAAGFLRKVEGGFGQLDTFVTNLDSSSDDRHKALDLLVQTLLNEAKILELRGIYAITSNENIVMRAQCAGFTAIPQMFLGRHV